MKVEEVPQDGQYLACSNIRDIYYALDENGNYSQVASVGWNVKNEALSLTWENISEEAELVRQEVLAGKKSPLAYHMERLLFSPSLLAAYSGIPKKTIKKHLLPDEFAQLDETFLQKYADILNITIDELKKFDA
jgi:spore germination protein GerM